MVNGVTGKTLMAMPSRLSKMVFYEKFLNLANAANLRKKMSTYHDAKNSAPIYQAMKKAFFKHLEDQGYGKWMGKPIEQDMFG